MLPAAVPTNEPAAAKEPAGMASSQLSPGPFAEAVLVAKTLVQTLPHPAPWKTMFDADGCHKPRSAEQARAKLANNASKFAINYTYFVMASAATALAFAPLAACAVAVAAAASAWVLWDTKHVGVKVLQGVTRVQRQSAAAAMCGGAVLLSGAVGVVATGALVGAGVCAAHGVMYEAPVDFGG
jgi:hypothetical protein